MGESMGEAGENYLETIWMLKEKNQIVRAVDLARELGYSKASISYGLGNLKKAGCVVVKAHGSLELTEKGTAIAQRVYDRHRTLTAFFALCAGVSEEEAERDACRAEHILSEEIYQGIKRTLARWRLSETDSPVQGTLLDGQAE